MATTLELTLLYLVAAVLGVVVFRSLKLPPMLGYLVVGVLIGPNALAFAQDSAGVQYLAEFGVVFLMFVIGLEFNLPKLRSMRTLVFGLGMSQVAADDGRRGARALPAGVGLEQPQCAALGDGLAGRGRAGRRDGDVVHRHRRQAARRAAGAGVRARPPRHGRAAVPGPGRGAAAGADPGAGLQRRGAGHRGGLGHRSRPPRC